MDRKHIGVALVALLCGLWLAAGLAIAAEESQRVTAKDKAVVKNDKIDHNDEEDTQPESVESLAEGKIRIISKTFLPPERWKFKVFKDAATHVDIWANPEGLGFDRLKDTDTEVKIRGVFPAPKNAGNFPLRGEGNLQPPADPGAPREFHWAAKVIDLEIDGIISRTDPIDRRIKLALDLDGDGKPDTDVPARAFGKFLVYDMSTTPTGIMDPDTTWVISENLTLQVFEITKPEGVPPVIKQAVQRALEAGLALGNTTTINLGSQTHPVTGEKLKKNQFMDAVVSIMPNFAVEWRIVIRQELFAQTPAGKFRFRINQIAHKRKLGEHDPTVTIMRQE